MPAWYDWQGSDLLITVQVQPRARQDAISGVQGEALKIRINALPVDGKANAHLCAYLARLCNVSKTAVSINTGESSRIKRLRIRLPGPHMPEALRPFC